MDGEVVVRLPVSTDVVDWLIAEGLLPAARELDREEIAAALLTFVTRHAADTSDSASSPL
ncbi:MAG: hypothetical protein U1E60_18970 [Reyranellaceae bacterium]